MSIAYSTFGLFLAKSNKYVLSSEVVLYSFPCTNKVSIRVLLGQCTFHIFYLYCMLNRLQCGFEYILRRLEFQYKSPNENQGNGNESFQGGIGQNNPMLLCI